MNELPTPKTSYHCFSRGCVEMLLELKPPPFTRAAEVFAQLRYVERYAEDLKCRSIVIETPYIDRDHMEDHSTFYSRSLFPYSNYCTRIHFFSIDESEVPRRLRAAIELGAREGPEALGKAGQELSESYLGFTVIKPLRGSPVGRTVLRCFDEIPSDPEPATQFRRSFDCVLLCKAHLLGVELSVRGLAFQQQDAAVSACATTAIWSSLQKMGDHEDITPATPAQITTLASRYSLPFGRAMPSEGLSLDQMCQAIQALGVSPSILRAHDYETARGYLYCAIKSGTAPILILEQQDTYHAVVVTGMKLNIRDGSFRDAAEKLIGIYIHDDRKGPYLRACLADKDGEQPRLEIPERDSGVELWRLTHIITPVYPKNRLSFSGLREAALHIAGSARGFAEHLKAKGLALSNTQVTVDYWVSKPHGYVSEQFSFEDTHPSLVRELLAQVPMPRYLGIVRLSADWFGEIDVLIDTTSTRRNAVCLAVVPWLKDEPTARELAKHLATEYDCIALPRGQAD